MQRHRNGVEHWRESIFQKWCVSHHLFSWILFTGTCWTKTPSLNLTHVSFPTLSFFLLLHLNKVHRVSALPCFHLFPSFHSLWLCLSVAWEMIFSFFFLHSAGCSHPPVYVRFEVRACFTLILAVTLSFLSHVVSFISLWLPSFFLQCASFIRKE